MRQVPIAIDINTDSLVVVSEKQIENLADNDELSFRKEFKTIEEFVESLSTINPAYFPNKETAD